MKFDASKDFPDLLSNLRNSPGKEAVRSLEKIKKRKKGSKELKGMIDFV